MSPYLVPRRGGGGGHAGGGGHGGGIGGGGSSGSSSSSNSNSRNIALSPSQIGGIVAGIIAGLFVIGLAVGAVQARREQSKSQTKTNKGLIFRRALYFATGLWIFWAIYHLFISKPGQKKVDGHAHEERRRQDEQGAVRDHKGVPIKDDDTADIVR